MRSNKLRKWGIGGYWLFAILYWEILTHAGMYGKFQGTFRFALGFGAAIGLALAFFVYLLPRRAAFPVSLILSVFLTVVYGSQLVYCFIFGTPYSVSQMGMGGDALSQFWRETLTTMGDHILWILALLVPIAALIVIHKLSALDCPGWGIRIIPILLAVAFFALTYWDICRGDRGMYSNYYFFTSPKSTTAQTLERFGVPITFYLEMTHTEEPENENMLLAIPEQTIPPKMEAENEIPKETVEEETVPEPTVYNVLDIDFDSLSASTTDERLIALNNYCSQISATNQNAYTGMLRDYNLILICAESFSPAAVDETITPTLYKLTHEGFLFRNYYNSFPNTTIDGEYSLLQGLYPDGTRGKDNSSMLASATHDLPLTIGNTFAQQLGVSSWGYHNNWGTYYGRDKSHPNLGYEMKFTGKGMTFTDHWPSSDLEMMEQSVDDYIHEPQFHAYYMTFSGHYQYKPDINGIAKKNYDLVKDLPDYCTEQKAYLACNIELDRALEYLLQRLEEEGIADKTAIVLAGDHFPYGLMKKQYFEMIGQPEDFFGAYKSDLIFWVGGLDEPIEVNEYCCNVDVLPTILNLWGIEYDSRLLAGTDVFSDGPHIAVLIDRSFLTDKVWFNSNNQEVRYQVPEEQVSENYVENMNRFIASRFDFSAQILRNDYYRFVFESISE